MKGALIGGAGLSPRIPWCWHHFRKPNPAEPGQGHAQRNAPRVYHRCGGSLCNASRRALKFEAWKPNAHEQIDFDALGLEAGR